MALWHIGLIRPHKIFGCKLLLLEKSNFDNTSSVSSNRDILTSGTLGKIVAPEIKIIGLIF